MGLFARMVAEHLFSIQEDKSRNNSHSNSHLTGTAATDHALLPSTIPREVDTDIDCLSKMSGISCAAVSDGLGDSARGPPQQQYQTMRQQLSVPQVNEPEGLVVQNASTTLSADDGSSPLQPQQEMMGQDALISLARQLDEQDSQAKRRAAASSSCDDPTTNVSGAPTPQARYSRRRSRVRKTAVVQAADDLYQQQEHDRLKEQLLLQLDSAREQEPSPGAYHVTGSDDDHGGRLRGGVVRTTTTSHPQAAADRRSRSSTNEEQRREANDTGGGNRISMDDTTCHGPISNGQLIEAYLVAQRSNRSTTGGPEASLEDKRSDLLAAIGAADDFPKSFWNMSDSEFLDALSNVIANRATPIATTRYSSDPASLPLAQRQQDDRRRDVDITLTAAAAAQQDVVAAAVLQAVPDSRVARATIIEAPVANRITRKDEEPEVMQGQQHTPPTKPGNVDNDGSFCCCSDAANATIGEVNV